jgi:hypothetical protein
MLTASMVRAMAHSTRRNTADDRQVIFALAAMTARKLILSLFFDGIRQVEVEIVVQAVRGAKEHSRNAHSVY